MTLTQRVFVAEALIVAPIPARVGQLVCISSYSDGRAFITVSVEDGSRIAKKQIVESASAERLLNGLCASGALSELLLPEETAAPSSKRVRRTKRVVQ